MEADFQGLFSNIAELWRFIGATGHAAVYLGVMLGFFLITVRDFITQIALELGAKTTHEKRAAQTHSKWRIPALEK